MIQKDKVTQIVVANYNNKFFKVYGLNQYGVSKKRMYHDYNRALKYSIVLRDYYQVDVNEIKVS